MAGRLAYRACRQYLTRFAARTGREAGIARTWRALSRGKRVVVHTEKEIVGIRVAAKAAAWVREALCRAVRPGMTTQEVDDLAAAFIRQTGGTSAFLGYRGFPGQVCISLNDEVVHGIGRPGRVIEVGDLLSIDVGVRADGYVGDTATTLCVGPPRDASAPRLIDVARESLARGIAQARQGRFVGDISCAVERTVSRASFSVVRAFVGHGCGCELHEPPEVPNFATASRGPGLRPGMVLAIEPMINAGGSDVTVDDDGWTVRTADGSLSAHVEHMVLVTEGEPEVLTWQKTA